MKGYESAAKALAECGVTTLFGLIGDANMHTVATFVDEHDGRYIGAVTEAGAVSMADGFARVSGTAGVATVTHGPGFTNTITALIEAVRAQTPLVLLTGDPVSKRGFAQRVDLSTHVAATGAAYHRTLSSDNIADDVTMAIAFATASRRPVVLNIAFDLIQQTCEYRRTPHHVVRPESTSLDAEVMDEMLGVLASARRPLVLVGRGAVLAGALSPIVQLADQLGAPLATTASAKDAFRDHPHALGILGSVATPRASAVAAKADCVIAFGASLSRYTTFDGELLAGRPVIQCIDRVGPIDSFVPSVTVLGDAKVVAQALSDELSAAEISRSGFAASETKAGNVGHAPDVDFVEQTSDAGLDPRVVMVSCDSWLPPDRVIVSDVGRFVVSPWRYLRVNNPSHFLQTGSYASIGLAIPAAIGAALAAPSDHATFAVVGDGAAMMSIIEMSTAVRHGIHFSVLVLNDGAYGAEYAKFEALAFSGSRAFNNWPALHTVATALGCDGRRVTTMDELKLACDALPSDRPLLIDVAINPHLNPATD